MTPTPAWAFDAAHEVDNYFGRGIIHKLDDVANIIAKHAPQPKAFEWEHWVGDTWYAKTPFGDYRVSSKEWGFNGYFRTADSLDAAKAAAFSDYCKRLKACYGEAHE